MNIYSSKPSQCSKYKANFKVNEISRLYYVFENETFAITKPNSSNMLVEIVLCCDIHF